MNRIFLIITLGLLLLAEQGFAQQSDDASFEQEGSSTENSEQTEPAQEQAQPEVNPDASFTPTEEISEDAPVAFPVDI